MGGFTFNGCGVGDSFYPKQNLGNHYCGCCKSIHIVSLLPCMGKDRIEDPF